MKFFICFTALTLLSMCLLSQPGVAQESVLRTPNFEGSVVFSLKNKSVSTAMTSTILTWQYIDTKVGYIVDQNGLLLSLNFDLENLEELGSSVKYAWKGLIDSSIGLWASYNFDVSAFDYGLMATLLEIRFE